MTQTVHVALGDSLSAGKGDNDSEGRPVGWARRLSELLSDMTGSSYDFTNLSASGATIADVHADQVPLLAGMTPDLITVTMGINDIRGMFHPDVFGASVSGLLDILVGTGATVVTITIPDIVHMLPLPPEVREAAREIIEAANDHIRTASASRDVLFIDAYLAPEVANADFWNSDRTHPSSQGHELIAAAAVELLLAAAPRRGVPGVAAGLPLAVPVTADSSMS